MSVLIEDCVVPGGTARSILVEGGVITKLSGSETQPAPSGAVRIDARGGAVLPGLVDTHCHPFGRGAARRIVDLRGTSSITSMRLRLEARVKQTPPGAWIFGAGWDQEGFSEGRFPNRGDIDSVAPHNPVVLTRVCGHIALANSPALEALKLGSGVGDEYERDQAGALTGIIKERALERALAGIPGETAETRMDDLLAVEQEAVRLGLTELHCIVSPDGYREELNAILGLKAAGRLALRYRLYLPPESFDYLAEEGIQAKLADDRVRINGVKIFADGSMGARTAALRQPYSDDPANSGLLRHSDEELEELVSDAAGRGFQVVVHAIGDRAVEQAADALAPLASGGNPRRHRIEHASLVPRDLRSRMKSLGLRAAVQPQFIVSDIWARARLGDERVRDLYPLRSMLEEGIILSGSSDAPVETMSPLLGMWASMTRSDYALDERLSLEQAIALYTSNAASNGFDEERLGAVREGGAADLTVLDSDVRGMHPALLRKVGVAATLVEGRIVYS
ncbi:MAG TPA: amidohydrolase, partial [Nitrososphaerales archaeon]|nr:amidohydrolase [Nitrososphaerales archaeon]